jgi:hypothetical protein
MAQVLDDADRARPHLVVDGKAVATEARVLRAAAPAGGIVTCAEDASRWLLLQTGHGPIPADVVARTHDLQAPLPTGALPFTEMRFVGYAMGWVVGTYKGRAASWHSGGVDGYLTQTLVLPDDGIAVVACANSHLSGLPLASVLHVVDGLLGETVESTWFDRMAPDAHVEADGGADGRATDTVPAAEGPRAHPLESYAGTYTDRGYGDLVVAVDGSELTVSLGLVALPAAHRRFDTWNLHYAPLELDLPATFVTDANGAVAEVVVPLDPATEPARFRRVEAANP